MRKSLVFLGSLVLGLCGVAHADLNDGLIAYYPFNGNANDESGNGNDGVLRGATSTEGRFSEPESALHFNGQNNYVALGYPNTLRLTEDFTISAWAYYSGGGYNSRILSFGQDFGYELMVETNDKPNFVFAGRNHRVDNAVPLNTWFHLTATKSNNTIRLYLDGVLVLEEPNVGTPIFNWEFRFGEKSQHGNGWWTGKIDDTRFYDRALTNREIASLYALESQDFQVQIVEGNFTWQEAKADAEAKGGRLAVLDTQEKIDAANSYLEELGFPLAWFGLTDENDEGNWQWITGEPLTLSNWGGNDPNGGFAENYGIFNDSGTWYDGKSSLRSNYLLEILTQEPAPPVVELEAFYESNPDETITIDATPISGFPDEFYYSWTFNGFEIPSFLGGNQPTMNLLGDVAQDGTWSVIVSNSVGSTEVSFEYRMFVDNDSDGLSNYREENFTLTNPDLADSDSDGLNDPDELSIHGTDPNIADVDEDGLNDSEEIAATTNPSVADTDNDGILDGVEVKTYASNPKKADTDNDGIADAAEIAAGLDINTAESIADAVAFLTQELANRPPVDGFEEAIAAARASGQEDVTSNPSEYNLYDAASYDAVVQERDARPTPAEYALVIEDRDSRPSLQAYNAVVADRDSRPTKEAYDAVVAQRDARPTKEAYDTAIAERDARPTLEEVKDGRLGSVLLLPDAAENKVKIRFSIEESDELGAWTSRTEEAEVDIPLAAGKRFFRFSVKEDE